jgi:hypothetical protein
MSESKPFHKDGEPDGAVPAVPQPKRPQLLCACCGESIPDDVPIDIIQDGSRLTGISPRGRAALLLCVDGVEELAVATIDYADALRLVDAFSKRQDLKCARLAEEL